MSTVDRATTGTAVSVWRMVLRVLTVAGGCAAGTVITWVISSSCSAAEAPGELVPPLQVVGVDQPADPETGRWIVEPVSDVVGAVGRLGSPSVPLLGAVVREPGTVIHVPAGRDELARSDRPGADPAPGGGPQGTPSSVRPVGEQSAAAFVPAGQHRGGHVAATVPGRALDDGGRPRGVPDPGPVVPVAVPHGAPGTGSTGTSTGGTDLPASTLSGIAGQRQGHHHGFRPACAVAAPHGQPGTQPGRTPD